MRPPDPARHTDLARAGPASPLARLADVEVPRDLADRVMAGVRREPGVARWRVAVAAFSFAAWALAVHQIVAWTAAELSGVV